MTLADQKQANDLLDYFSALEGYSFNMFSAGKADERQAAQTLEKWLIPSLGQEYLQYVPPDALKYVLEGDIPGLVKVVQDNFKKDNAGSLKEPELGRRAFEIKSRLVGGLAKWGESSFQSVTPATIRSKNVLDKLYGESAGDPIKRKIWESVLKEPFPDRAKFDAMNAACRPDTPAPTTAILMTPPPCAPHALREVRA